MSGAALNPVEKTAPAAQKSVGVYVRLINADKSLVVVTIPKSSWCGLRKYTHRESLCLKNIEKLSLVSDDGYRTSCIGYISNGRYMEIECARAIASDIYAELVELWAPTYDERNFAQSEKPQQQHEGTTSKRHSHSTQRHRPAAEYDESSWNGKT